MTITLTGQRFRTHDKKKPVIPKQVRDDKKQEQPLMVMLN
jgi:hypothetical protein